MAADHDHGVAAELSGETSGRVAGERDLDHPVHVALSTVHAGFAQRRGRVLRYPAEVAPFFALPPSPTPADWADAVDLIAPGAGGLVHPADALPPPWRALAAYDCVQMVGPDVPAPPGPGSADLIRPAPAPAGPGSADLIRLGPVDVPEMLELVRRTAPGPFLPRTIELGNYLGHRIGGELVAMAGERLHLTGWTEISAVCTLPSHRGRGLAARLMTALTAGIRARAERPFLHVMTTNTGAIRVYEQLGFRVRRELTIVAVTPVPETSSAP